MKFHIGEAFAMAGETDRAIDLIEDALDTGFYAYDFISKYCPFMEPLRDEPRFDSLMDKAKRLNDAFIEAMA